MFEKNSQTIWPCLQGAGVRYSRGPQRRTGI